MLSMFYGAAHVIDRCGRIPGNAGRRRNRLIVNGFAGEGGAGRFHVQGNRGHRADGYTGRLDGLTGFIQVDPGSGIRHRDIHFVARDKAQERGAGVCLGRRNSQGDQDFIGRQRSQAGSGADFFHRRLTFSTGAGDMGGCAVDDDRWNRVGAGRSIAQVAAEGCPPLDLYTADQGRRICQGRKFFGYFLVFPDCPATDCGADGQPAGIQLQAGKFRNFFCVDDDIG